MAKIIGNTTATPNPRPDWEQTDATKADYIKNKPILGTLSGKSEVVKDDLALDVQTSLDKADTAIQSIEGLATEIYVDTKIADMVDSAPETLNTLNELADALGDDPNFAATIAEEIGKKQEVLVSGENIKTINGESVLGSGNITIENGSSIDVTVDQTYNPESENAQSGKVVAEAINNITITAGEGVGQATDEGGEIFNDYENNVAGIKGYKILSIENNTTVTVNAETPYIVGDIVNLDIASHYYGIFKISEIKSATSFNIANLDDSVITDDLTLDGEEDWVYVVGKSSGESVTQAFYAHAEGLNNKAIGLGAHAEGKDNQAIGNHAHAEGRQTVANYAAHAEGRQTKANGQMSHAEGYKTSTSGRFSHAEGDGTKAIGEASHTEGRGSIANGVTAHAEGETTRATGQASHAEGRSIRKGENGAIEDIYNTASGIASHVEGIGTIATNSASHAENYKTQATGYVSHAEGNGSVASGNTSHAEGFETVASGQNAHSEGHGSTASAQASHAEGFYSKAEGAYSHAGGKQTYAGAAGAHAEGIGNGTKTKGALGTASHSEGLFTIASGENSHAEGDNTLAQGTSSHSEGTHTEALKLGSHAEGYYTHAEGDNAHSEGQNTVASGSASHAEGSGSQSQKFASHAEGTETIASNSGAHAEGYKSEASGEYSHAENYGTKAIGKYSHTSGNQTVAGYEAQTVIGKFNDNKEDTLFEVGNGTSNTNRNNAFEVYKNGDVKIGALKLVQKTYTNAEDETVNYSEIHVNTIKTESGEFMFDVEPGKSGPIWVSQDLKFSDGSKIDVSYGRITGLLEPEFSDDAVNKSYVDEGFRGTHVTMSEMQQRLNAIEKWAKSMGYKPEDWAE